MESDDARGLSAGVFRRAGTGRFGTARGDGARGEEEAAAGLVPAPESLRGREPFVIMARSRPGSHVADSNHSAGRAATHFRSITRGYPFHRVPPRATAVSATGGGTSRPGGPPQASDHHFRPHHDNGHSPPYHPGLMDSRIPSRAAAPHPARPDGRPARGNSRSEAWHREARERPPDPGITQESCGNMRGRHFALRPIPFDSTARAELPAINRPSNTAGAPHLAAPWAPPQGRRTPDGGPRRAAAGRRSRPGHGPRGPAASSRFTRAGRA